MGSIHFLQPKAQYDFRDKNQLFTWKYGKDIIFSKYWRLQSRWTLLQLRQNSLVSNGRIAVKIKSNYRGLTLSHTPRNANMTAMVWEVNHLNMQFICSSLLLKKANAEFQFTNDVSLVENFFPSFLWNTSNWRHGPNLPQPNLFKMRCNANKFLSSKLLNYAKQIIAFMYVMSHQIMKDDSSCLFILPSYVCSMSHSLI